MVHKRKIFLKDDARSPVSIFFGSSGAGKTKLSFTHLVGDVYRFVHGLSTRGWVYIDVLGTSSLELLDYLSLLFSKFPEELAGRILYIDLTLPDWVVPYNPLILRPDQYPERKANEAATALADVFSTDTTQAVRFYRVAYHTLLTLIKAKRPLVEAYNLLLNETFRNDLLLQLSDDNLNLYWFSEYSAKGINAAQLRESSLNRFGRFSGDPDVSRFLSGETTFTDRDLVDRTMFTIFRLPTGLMPDTARMLASLIFANLWYAGGTGRADTPEHERHYTTLCMDEFQLTLNPLYEQATRLGRQFHIDLYLLTQDTLPPEGRESLYNSLLNSARNIIAGQLSYRDTERIVRELFQPDFDQVKYQDVNHVTFRSMEEIWQREIVKITTLNPRQFWWKQRYDPVTHLIESQPTPDVRQLPQMPELRENLLTSIRQQYGRSKKPALTSPVTVRYPYNLSPVPVWGN